MVRQIAHYYDLHPQYRPQFKQGTEKDDGLLDPPASIELSEKELAQIKEIFDLFDTDGGGTIDREELDAAMFALGFRAGKGRGGDPQPERDDRTGTHRLGSLVTLEQFTSLMKGELTEEKPTDGIWLAFSVLCCLGRPEGRAWASPKGLLRTAGGGAAGGGARRVTMEGLRAACRLFDMSLTEGEMRLMVEDAGGGAGRGVDAAVFARILSMSPWF